MLDQRPPELYDPDRYAIIGHPVAHSKITGYTCGFSRAQTETLRWCTSEVLSRHWTDFVRTVDRIRVRAALSGANVTLPFKVDAFRLAVERTLRAEAAEAVNTLTFDAANIRGDTTDGVGLVRDIESRCGRALKDQCVLVVGAGGAARGAVGPLLAAGPMKLAIANRTLARALDIVQLFADTGPVSALTLGELPQHQFDVVINATSASLADALPLVPPSVFAPGALAYDMVYGKGQTPFLQLAAGAGARTSDGLGMLVEQAAEAFHVWHGVRPDTAPVYRQLAAGS